jgi:coenzyme F420-reducing hydrogenase gamma subunit
MAQVVLEIPGCPAVRESWYSEITPLLKGRSSTTTNLSPYQKILPSFLSGKVVAQQEGAQVAVVDRL